MSQSEGPKAGQATGESARRTTEAMTEAARENMQAGSQLTRDLIERNTELAMQVAPAVFQGYERALRSFATFYEQAGQQMGQMTGAMAQGPASVAESMTQAAQSMSQIPAQVGQTMAQAGQAASKVPKESMGGQTDLPGSVAALASAQAAFMRDVAETLGMARELLEQPHGADRPAGSTGGSSTGGSSTGGSSTGGS
jgi:hypothetical protein